MNSGTNLVADLGVSQRRYGASECREDVMNVDGFGGDPFWLICLKVAGLFVLLVVIVLITIWASAGSSAGCRAGSVPTGSAPSVCCSRSMDGVKLALKEEIMTPQGAELGRLHPGAAFSADGVRGLRGHPARPGGLDLRARHARCS
jgi:hypothetical protein